MQSVNYKITSNGRFKGTSIPFVVRTFVLLAMAGIGFSGCSLFDKSPDKTKPMEVNILPTNTRTGLLAFLENQLVDPVGVREAYITEPKLQEIGADNRYVVCVRYNAKDYFGQYTGSRDFIAIYFAAKLTQFVPASAEQCRNAAYLRYPELEGLKKAGSR